MPEIPFIISRERRSRLREPEEVGAQSILKGPFWAWGCFRLSPSPKTESGGTLTLQNPEAQAHHQLQGRGQQFTARDYKGAKADRRQIRSEPCSGLGPPHCSSCPGMGTAGQLQTQPSVNRSTTTHNLLTVPPPHMDTQVRART